MRTKICGIRSEADHQAAVHAGADAIGVICGVTHHSEDVVGPELGRHLVALTPPFVSTVLVTHLEDADDILALASRVGVDTIQVHGLVSPDTLQKVYARSAGRTIVKAIHVEDDTAVTAATEAAPFCDAVLLDSRTRDRLGGTGQTHDWSISRSIVVALAGTPTILAGGLTMNNVISAIAQVRPYAVDVNSGVEDAAGDKDVHACAAFVANSQFGHQHQ